MSLKDQIEHSHKEIVGSRTKNRLTIQNSYAMQLIMDFYPNDFAVLMDYIEDISVVFNPSHPDGIRLYQIKTKSADKQYGLATIISEEWYQKLYSIAQKYDGYVCSAELICNTDIVNRGNTVFPNERNRLGEQINDNNVKKIRAAIAKDQCKKDDEIDLSKFYFVRSHLSTKGHQEEVEYKFSNFLADKEKNVQVETVKAIFSLIYSRLDHCFNCEIDEDCNDLNEIIEKKSISSNEIKNIISTGLAIQMPTLADIFEAFDIKSVKLKRNYSEQYPQIKMDMYSDTAHFIESKQYLVELITMTVDSCADEADDIKTIFDSVYEKAAASDQLSVVYKEESYMKLLIMILLYKYCNGGEIK